MGDKVELNPYHLDDPEGLGLLRRDTRRTWYTGGELQMFSAGHGEPEFRHRAARLVVLLSALLLFAIGAAGIVIGALQMSGSGSVAPLCQDCRTVNKVFLGAGAVFVFFGGVGFAAAACRLKLLAAVFCVCLALVFLSSAAVCAAGVVYHSDSSLLDLSGVWAKAVKEDPDVVCTVQRDLQCSGFDHCCVRADNSSESESARDDAECVPASGALPKWYAQECTETCAAVHARPCEPQLKDEIKKQFAAIIGGTCGVAVLALLVMVATVRMVLRS